MLANRLSDLMLRPSVELTYEFHRRRLNYTDLGDKEIAHFTDSLDNFELKKIVYSKSSNN